MQFVSNVLGMLLFHTSGCQIHLGKKKMNPDLDPVAIMKEAIRLIESPYFKSPACQKAKQAEMHQSHIKARLGRHQ